MNTICNVLVVEDDGPMRKLLHRQLTALGCEVDIARDGNEGLSLWECNDYDLVLTDFSMPGMDGSELASRIRGSKRGKGRIVPLIAITGKAEDANERLCAVGVTGCISKPFSSVDLRRMLRPWLPGCEDPGTTEVADSAIMRQVTRTFADTIPAYVLELRRARAAGTRSGILDLAHKLKSAARLVGGDEVAELCEAIEAAAEGRNVTKLAELADRVPPALSALEKSLRSSLE